MKLLGIIKVDFDIIDQLLIFCIHQILEKNLNKMGQYTGYL